MVARGDVPPAEPGVPRSAADEGKCRDRAAQSAARRKYQGDTGYKLPERGLAVQDLRISQAEAEGIIYDICHNYNGQGCQNGGKPLMDRHGEGRIVRDGREGFCWSLSGNSLRAHACTRCGAWAHSAFECRLHIDELPKPTVTPENVQRIMTGHEPSRFRDEQGNLPAGHRERQTEHYRERAKAPRREF